MAKVKFIGREMELKSFNSKWAEKKAQFIIVYGKRRVGKTELIKQFIKDKPSIYFLADQSTEKEQLKRLGALFGNYFNDPATERKGFDSWLDVFEYLKKNIKSKFVLVIDEYPYLAESNKAVSSIFQKGWDEYLKNTNIFLILSGSSVAMMESETLIYKSPLYGRRTGQILLKPMHFRETRKFYPKFNFDKSLEIYAITGGVPAYILQIDPKLNVTENIKKEMFDVIGFLHNEVEFVLKEEFREPKNYLAILRAISLGKRKFGEISNDTGMEKNILAKYLQTLERLQMIERDVPVTEKNPYKSKKGLYQLSDNFFRFWFKFIFPHKSNIEIGQYAEVLRKMDEDFNSLAALVYENVCKETLLYLSDKIFTFERIGKWWDKNEEIDVVGLNESTKEILFGEVKWSNKKIGTDIYRELKRKAELVDWNKGNRKERFVLFSKSGFTKDMEELAKNENVILVYKDKIV